MKGDDYFVKEISLLYTEFKKMEGQVVQAPNSYLNSLFILNMRRSGGLAEAVPLTVKFGTTLNEIEELRGRLLEFVKAEKREYQGNILTEIRDVVEAHSINLNVVFFYKSNWQNEGLRLQRRNKFICAMMVSMQEIGIEGPLMRLPGQKSNIPFYVQYPSARSTETLAPVDEIPSSVANPSARDRLFVPRITGEHTEPRHQQSTLHYPSTLRVRETRGESVSSMAKRVDFSLGMRDFASGDVLGDVYDNGPRMHVPDIVRRSVSRGHDDRTTKEDNASVGTSTVRNENGAHSRFSLYRSSTEARSRTKAAHGTIRPNRFFRSGDRDTETDPDHECLMERGLAISGSDIHLSKIDPRTGTTSQQAMQSKPHKTTDRGVPDRDAETQAHDATDTFGMREMS